MPPPNPSPPKPSPSPSASRGAEGAVDILGMGGTGEEGEADASDLPLPRETATTSCSFCKVSGHTVRGCSVFKCFGTPMTNERWSALKEQAPLASAEEQQYLTALGGR